MNETRPLDDATRQLQAGTDALRRGDARAARAHLLQALESGRRDATVFVGLAYASLALNDHEAKMAAVEQLLAIEPRNIRGLMLKGDHLLRQGDGRSAVPFYQAALQSAADERTLPADLKPELERAQQMTERYLAEYQDHLASALRERGFDPARASPRFTQSLELLLGRKQVYVQQPRYFYFPELPQIQFYDRQRFPWLDELESATDDIRDELLELMKSPQDFAPYVQSKTDRPNKSQQGMRDNPDWSAAYLIKHGAEVTPNAERCPRTMAALANAPLARVPQRSPSVLFSVLTGGTRIPPHNGIVNTRLICHLPLIVPGRCVFRVGNDVREWQYGKAWVFDDTIEHEAVNTTSETRVILLFDIWRPELTEEERALVTALFESIDAYSGKRPDWTI
ncbi:MAG: aspartyl/asparaginyl beta-hydroxylase domain-containing protein [Steroidobacteraceae bacterium]